MEGHDADARAIAAILKTLDDLNDLQASRRVLQYVAELLAARLTAAAPTSRRTPTPTDTVAP